MSFKKNLLFVLVTFIMFSMGYPSPSKRETVPAYVAKLFKYSRPSSCDDMYDYGSCFFLSKESLDKKNYVLRYWYNNEWKRCGTFIYGGCGGNDNNFETYQECMATCNKK